MANLAIKHVRVPISAIAGLIILILISACGKKALPVAPHQEPAKPVTDLQVNLHGDMVQLTWTHHANETVDQYLIWRAQSDLAKPECKGCPQIFQKVGTVVVDVNNPTIRFSEQVRPGFRYMYKVKPYYASDVRGPDSNLAVIEYREIEKLQLK